MLHRGACTIGWQQSACAYVLSGPPRVLSPRSMRVEVTTVRDLCWRAARCEHRQPVRSTSCICSQTCKMLVDKAMRIMNSNKHSDGACTGTTAKTMLSSVQGRQPTADTALCPSPMDRKMQRSVLALFKYSTLTHSLHYYHVGWLVYAGQGILPDFSCDTRARQALALSSCCTTRKTT